MGLDVWSYSGYTLEELQKMATSNEDVNNFLNEIDVLVDGKFILAQRDLSLRFRGSSNQRIIDMKNTREKGKIVLLYTD